MVQEVTKAHLSKRFHKSPNTTNGSWWMVQVPPTANALLNIIRA